MGTSAPARDLAAGAPGDPVPVSRDLLPGAVAGVGLPGSDSIRC